MRTGLAPVATISCRRRAMRLLPASIVAAGAMACLVACSRGHALPDVPPDAVVAAPPSPSVEDPHSLAMRARPPGTAADTARPPPKMMPGRIYAPAQEEVACPSLNFEEFIQAFFNSGDLQVRFTARPVAYKVPYHDYHNTEPGDPANPQWKHYGSDRPMHDRFRYDPRLQTYVSDSSWLRPGQRWTGIDADGKHVSRPVTELTLRQESDEQWQVVTPGRITTFTRRPDCWYATGDWTLDPFEGCKWPHECRAWREYEGHEQEGE